MLKISLNTSKAFTLISNFLATEGYVYSEEQHAECWGAEEYSALCYSEASLVEDLELFKMVAEDRFEAYFNSFPTVLNMRLDLFQKRLDELPVYIHLYLDLRLQHVAN